MDITAAFRFPLGRYHANPWHQHVNVGHVDIPPSPWRVLRAIYAVWKTRAPHLDEPVVHSLLAKLWTPPTYFIPPHTLGHTRHYYPDTNHRSSTISNDSTLDAFAVLNPHHDLAVQWKVELADDEYKALDHLIAAMPYLGRADSICEARLQPDWKPEPHHTTWDLLDRATGNVSTSTTDLLAPTHPLDPQSLTQRPIDIRATGQRDPLGTRHITYYPNIPETPAPVRRATRNRCIEAVRFSIVSPVRPAATDTVTITERLRAASHSKHGTDGLSGSMLTGKTGTGTDTTPMKTQHRHAHYLATSDQHQRINELIVWAPGGLNDRETQALQQIHILTKPGRASGPPSCRITITNYGATTDVIPELTGPATQWTTITPLAIARRTRSRDWLGFLTKEITRELTLRGLPEPADITIDPDPSWAGWIRHRPSKRAAAVRHNKPSTPLHQTAPAPAAFVSIHFHQPQQGPISLGHLSHFGLGLLAPQ